MSKKKYFNLMLIKRSKRARTITAVVFSLVVALAAILAYGRIIEIYANQLVGDALVNLINNQSEKRFTITYDSIGVRAFNNKVSVKNFRIVDNRDFKNTSGKRINATIPFLQLDVDGIFLVWINDYLNVENVHIVQPHIEIVNYSRGEEVKFAAETGGFINVLRQQLNLLEIDRLSIEQAKVDYYENIGDHTTHLMHIDDLSLALDNFEWEVDDLNLSDLQSDGLSIEIKNQELALPDSSFYVRFDNLLYSLSNNELILQNVDLTEVRSNDLDHHQDRPMSLHLPELRISGMDYSKAFEKNILEIDAIKLLEPDLALLTQITKPAIEKRPKKDLQEIITKVFNRVLIDTIKMENGRGDIMLSDNEDYQQFHSDHLNLTISKLELDTTRSEDKQGYLSYQSVTLSAENYKSILKDSLNLLSIKKIYYSTDDQEIRADSLVIAPIDSVRSLHENHTTLIAPRVRITGFNEGLLSSGRNLVMEEFYASRILMNVLIGKREPNENPQPINEILKQTLKDKLSEINIKNIHFDSLSINVVADRQLSIEISNGSIQSEGFKWADDHPLTNNLPTVNIKLSEIDIKLPGENFDTKLIDTHIDFFNNHIKVAKARVNRDDSSFDAENIQIHFDGWVTQSSMDSLHIAYLSFDNYHIDWTHARSARQAEDGKQVIFLIDSLNLDNGSMQLHTGPYGLVSAKIPQLNATYLKLDEGVFFKDLSYEMSDVKYNFFEKSLSIEDLAFSSYTHALDLNTINFSSDFMQDSVSISIPSLRADSIQTDLLIKEHKLYFNELTLTNWNAAIYYDRNEIFKKIQEVNDAISLGGLKEIKFNKLNLKNGKVKQQYTRQHITEVDLQFNDIHIDSEFSRLKNPSRILFSKSVTGNIKNFIYIDDQLRVKAQNLAFLPGGPILVKKLNIEELTNQIDIDSIYLKKVAFNDLIDSKIFKAGFVNIYQPNIKLDLSLRDQGTKEESAFRFDVSNLSVHDAVVDVTTSSQQRIQLNPVDMELRGFQYDSTIDMSKTLIPAVSMSLTTRNLKFATADGLSEILVGSVNLSSDIHGFKIADIRMNPLYGRGEYMEHKGYETDWIEATIDEIELVDLDYFRLLNDKALVSRYLKINRPKLVVYRNKNLRDSLPDFRPLPMKILRELGSLVDIDSAQVTDASIIYQEVGKKGDKPGQIHFDSLYSKVYNITNAPAQIELNNKMRMDITTKIAGVPFQANFRFFLDHSDDKFVVSGALDANDMTRFNTMTENAAFVKVENGRCRKLNFTAVANNNMAYGSMYFHYNNLKVALVDKKTARTKKLEESVASFFANTFLIKKNNLALLKLRKGDIYFERNKQKSIFNYLSKLFMSGVSSSVGLKNFRKEIRKMMEHDENQALIEHLPY